MKSALIGGIGNVLLGDDGVGPYVIRLLEAQFTFAENVDVVDLGTPALDLTHRISGRHALILVDSVSSNDPPGTIVLYRKQDIIRQAPAPKLDQHSPALSECLFTADLLGTGPENVLLVGIVGDCYEPGSGLSEAVRQSVEAAIGAILEELSQLGFSFQKKPCPDEPRIWWDVQVTASPQPSLS